MARSKEPTGRFMAMREAAQSINETNDCSVRAVAAACNVSYMDAHAACAKAGRKPRSGMYDTEIKRAIESLGYVMKDISFMKRVVLKRIQDQHNYTTKNLTTRQFTKFRGVCEDAFDQFDAVLLWTNRHIVAYADGEIHDFGANHALQIYRISYVYKKGDPDPIPMAGTSLPNPRRKQWKS